MKEKIEKLLNKCNVYYISTFLFLLSFIVFGNTLTNNFVEDDKKYIINNLDVHTINLVQAFSYNNFNSAGQYRPIPDLYFSVLYTIFGTTPLSYHFLQILFHAICSILVYILFRKFLSKGISLTSSIVFLVHPMNVESVSYIAQTVTPLYIVFGLTGLIISIQKKFTNKNIFIVFFLLLLSLLTKETGILFIFLTIFYSLLFNRKNLKKLLLVTAIILVVYTFLHIVVGHIEFTSRLLIPIASLSLPIRIMHIPAILLYYLVTFIFPAKLVFDQQWTIQTFNLSTFYFPLLINILLFAGIYALSFIIHKNHKGYFKSYMFFLVWFIIGMVMNMQIFPLDMTVADRWFYFPIIGLIGLGSLSYERFIHNVPKYMQKTILVTIIAIIIIFSLRTIERNTNWGNALTLYTHDSKLSDNYDLENSLGNEYFEITDYKSALLHYEKSVTMRPNEFNLHNTGSLYVAIGDYKDALIYYKKALDAKDYKSFNSHKHDENSYKSYATQLLYFEKYSEAEKLLKSAVLDYPRSADLWMFLSLAKAKTMDKNGALNASLKAYQLDQSEQYVYIYSKLSNNQSFNIKLQEKTFSY